VRRILVYVGDSRVEVELLIMPDCPNAGAAHDLLRTELSALGLADTPIRVSEIDTPDAAEQRGFLGSPTVRINGVDPFAEPGRSPGLSCRVYPSSAGVCVLPPADWLRAALLAASTA
jgi:hypothetical protein